MSTSHTANAITSTNITNWNTAYNNYASRTYNNANAYLGATYISGGAEKPSYFGSGKLKLQMLNSASNITGLSGFGSWSDVLWLSSYTGSDVKGSNAIVISKSTNKIAIVRQDYDSTSWGTPYELAKITDNVASATALQNTRTIWGQSFNGTGNVSGALSSVTNITATGTLLTTGLFQAGTYNWTTKTGGFHSGIDGYLEGGLSFYNGSGTSASVYRLNNNLVLGRGASQSVIIDPSNNVSIVGSTTVKNLTLTATGTGVDASVIAFSRPSYNYLSAPLNGGISFVTNGDALGAATSMLVLSPNGNVGVGKGFSNNTTAIAVTLDVRGNIRATGEITAHSTSDKRLKNNILPLQNSVEILDKLNPVSYNWNEKAKELNPLKNTKEKQYGLIAQEVEDVLPEVVHSMYEDEYKGIDYVKLIPFLVGAIKEINQEIKELKSKLNGITKQ